MARILIVDDAQIMRNILSVMLEKAGHEIAGQATSGKEALEMYIELDPDLVTMDIQMGGGDGMTYLKEIIRLDPEARVIMVSALGHGEKEREARSIGAAGYISKPFREEDFAEAIRNVLGK